MSDVDAPGWGARRERRRRWRGRAILVAVLVLAGGAAIVLQIAADGNGVFEHDHRATFGDIPAWARAAAGIAFTLVLLAVARLNWRAADELKRDEIRQFWAAIGFTMLAMFPILHVLGPYLSADTRLAAVYAVGLAGGAASYLWRRGRVDRPSRRRLALPPLT